jgi:hypothetical protein
VNAIFSLLNLVANLLTSMTHLIFGVDGSTDVDAMNSSLDGRRRFSVERIGSRSVYQTFGHFIRLAGPTVGTLTLWR